MSELSYEQTGQGPPLLLLHGTGLTRACWDPVREQLAERRSLLLVDLPGHGRSPYRADLPHAPAGYAVALAELLDELGLDEVDVAGNSVGGWTALELAKIGRARSVVALAPAGLWPKHDPWPALLQLWADHQLSRLFAPVTPWILSRAAGRKLFMAGAFARPEQVPAAAAIAMSRSMANTARFTRHLRATRKQRFAGGQHLTVPITVIWGEKEKLIPKRARERSELPEHARVMTLSGVGHVMTYDDPAAVADAILQGSSGTSTP